jgi:hypothetical protein
MPMTTLAEIMVHGRSTTCCSLGGYLCVTLREEYDLVIRLAAQPSIWRSPPALFIGRDVCARFHIAIAVPAGVERH